jgi:hypothetical protein
MPLFKPPIQSARSLCTLLLRWEPRLLALRPRVVQEVAGEVGLDPAARRLGVGLRGINMFTGYCGASSAGALSDVLACRDQNPLLGTKSCEQSMYRHHVAGILAHRRRGNATGCLIRVKPHFGELLYLGGVSGDPALCFELAVRFNGPYFVRASMAAPLQGWKHGHPNMSPYARIKGYLGCCRSN